jgi:hypothetical protein
VIESAFDRVSGSNYNAFYLRAQHTAGKSLTVLGSFSWSKSMDDASSGALDQTVTDVFGYSYPQLPYTRAGEYSLSTFDIPVIVNDNPQIGNAPRTLGGARNPRDINLDLSLRKSFSLSPDHVWLQLRADALNGLNHPNYFFGTSTANHNLYSGISSTAINTSIENTAFGNITSAGPARIVALGAFVTF